MENLVLYGKTIAFLATDGFEQIELTQPWSAIKNAGGTVKLVSPKIEGTIRGVHHDVPGDEFIVDILASDAIVEEYDALVLPGGVFSPDALRLNEESVQFVRAFMDANKPVAAKASKAEIAANIQRKYILLSSSKISVPGAM